MKKYEFEINGNIYNVRIKSFEDNTVGVEVNGTPYDVLLKEEVKTKKTPKLVRAKTPETEKKKPLTRSGGLSTIKAPLPGKILSVAVKEGDSVKKDDLLLVMEAMKMENSINSSTAGVVKSIKVAAGESVLQDDILIEIE
jgi:biotin carboxyl carrier protein